MVISLTDYKSDVNIVISEYWQRLMNDLLILVNSTHDNFPHHDCLDVNESMRKSGIIVALIVDRNLHRNFPH